MKDTNQEEKVMKEKSQDIFNIFETVIKRGAIEKEETIIPGLKIKVRPLSVGEVAEAESRVSNMIGSDNDAIQKVKSSIILSKAIIALNDSPVEQEDAPREDTIIRRRALYLKIMDLPTSVVMKMWEVYINVVSEQNQAMTTIQKIEDQAQDFYKRPLEI